MRLPAACLMLLALIQTACGNGESYLRIHDATLNKADDALVLLVEHGSVRRTGGIFDEHWTYSPDELALWRVDRHTAALARLRAVPMGEDFKPYHGAPRLAEWIDAAISLPDCGAALTRCALRRMPEPYTARHEHDGRDRGLQVIDPAAGILVRAAQGKLQVSDWTLRTAADAQAAANRAYATAAARVHRTALRQLKSALADSGSLPRERSATIVDGAITQGFEGMRVEYHIDAGGIVVAKLGFADDLPTQLRWLPSEARDADGMPANWRCESDRAETAAWLPACALMERPETIDPELVYLMERMAQIKASAAADAPYQSARRGLTFGVRQARPSDGEVWVGCLGLPGSRVGDCDVTRGDTVCSVSLPLLCLREDAEAQPRHDSPTMRGNWMSARLAASEPVRGDTLTGAVQADAVCAAQFGAGWRQARWTDHGESFIAKGEISAVRRLWVQSPPTYEGNCWGR